MQSPSVRLHVVGQILDLLIVDRQRTINSIDLTVVVSGRDDIRTKQMDFGLGQV
jgi:hypothetical protein